MKDKLKSLTWKYFIEQKIAEITSFILIVIAIISVSWLVGWEINILSMGTSLYEPNPNFIMTIMTGFLATILLCISLVVLYNMLSDPILYWIDCNWDKAKKRAEEDLK